MRSVASSLAVASAPLVSVCGGSSGAPASMAGAPAAKAVDGTKPGPTVKDVGDLSDFEAVLGEIGRK